MGTFQGGAALKKSKDKKGISLYNMHMHFLRERKTPNEIIATMALFSALVALFSLLSGFFPFLTPFFMIAVPLAPAFIALTCPLKFLPAFVFAAFAVSLGVSFFDFQALLFYLLPSLIVGAFFGVLRKAKASSILNLFLSGILSTLLLLFTLYLSKLIYNISFFDLFSAFFPLANPAYMSHVFLLFCFAYGLGQCVLIHLFIHLVFSKFSLEENEVTKPAYLPYLLGGLSGVLIVAFAFFFVAGSYLFLGFLVFWAVATAVKEIPYRHIGFYVLDVFFLFFSILLFAMLYPLLKDDTGLLLIAIPFAFLLFTNGMNASLPLMRAKHKIKRP